MSYCILLQQDRTASPSHLPPLKTKQALIFTGIT